MKLLLTVIFLTLSLSGVQIDNRLYEGPDTLVYYDQLTKKFANDVPIDDEDAERLKSEKSLLVKLRTLITKEPSIQIFETSLIEKIQITDIEYLKLFNVLSNAVDQKNKLKVSQIFNQEKLSYLKKHIEDISTLQHKNLQLYQLQFAYYKLKLNHDKISIENYEQFIASGEKILPILIPRITFDLQAYDISIVKNQKELARLNKKLIAANLSKERELLSQETISKKLADKLAETQKEQAKILKLLADKTLLKGLYYFQQKDVKAVLTTKKEYQNILNQLPTENGLYTAKFMEFEQLTKSIENSINYNILTIKETFLTLYENFFSYVRTPFLVIDETPISFFSILKILGVLLLGFITAKIYFKIFTRLHKKRKDMSAVSIKVIANIGSTFILFVTFIIAMSSIGLSVANLAVLAGALSIGIGFALRSVVSNMIGGMVILSENYIKIGDYIRIDPTMTGKVMDIGFRASVIKTIDNIHMIIPNTDLIDGKVVNLTFEDRIRRIYVPFKVPYGSDVKKIRSFIIDAVMEASHIKLIRDVRLRKPTVWMSAVGESFIELELLVWIEGIRPSTKSNLLILIYETLNTNGISMPLPQLDLHIKDKRVLNALR